MQITDEILRSATFAVMKEDGCGATIDTGERVLCTDTRLPSQFREIECSCLQQTRAALAAAFTTIETMGLVVVPKEATPEMTGCVVEPALVIGSEQNGRVVAWRQALYKAMIGAAIRASSPTREAGE
jgi:hypothetical protein